MPPTSCSGGRPICRPSTGTITGPPSTPSSPTTSPPFWAGSSTATTRTRWATASTCASKGRASNDTHGHGFDQNVRQVRPDPSHRDYGQGRLLFQALPRGRTTQRRIGMKLRPDEENHLQPGRAAGTAVRRQPPLPGVPVGHRRSQQWHRQAQQDHARPSRRRALIAASTSSTRTTKPFSCPWPAASSPSAAVQNKDLRRRVKGKNTGQISRLMKRLPMHGLIKKVGKTNKYYLTALGKQVIALGLKLKNLYIIPALAAAAS